MRWRLMAYPAPFRTHATDQVVTQKNPQNGMSAQAYIASQQHEGWICLPERYDDGGYSGGNMDRPALKRLLADVQAGRVDCAVTYKRRGRTLAVDLSVAYPQLLDGQPLQGGDRVANQHVRAPLRYHGKRQPVTH